MSSSHFSLRNTIWLLTGLALLFVIVWRAPAFYAVQGLASYLPLHMFAETFSIVVSMMVFGIAWNIHSKERQDNFVILACALLAVGLIDFAHMLSFKGMPDFITPSGPEKAINFWLSARLIAALALLAVSIRSWRPSHNPRIRHYLLAISLVVAAVVIWLGLAYPQAWPHTFIEGTGLTPFKIGAEYAIIAILLVPAIRFYRQSGQRQSYDAASLFAATVVTILSELSFTVYSDVADIFNLLGHLYKIVAYAFIYRAVFVGSVNEPFHRLDAELAENTRITKQLQDSAAERTQLAAIVEFSNDAIIGKTPEGVITSWNKGAEKIYGYSAAEIIGKHITILALPEQHAEMRQLLEKVRNGEIITNHEAERVHKDGTRFHVSLTLSPIRDASGKISGISTIARDITEQKRMERERAETLRYFESMDRVNRAMQGAKDLEGMLSDVLGEVLEIFDCDRVGLVHPCDPHSPTWQIVMERAKPGFSTEPIRGPLPMTSIRADSMQLLLDANGPVQFIPEDDPEKERLNTFGIRSFMSIAVHPRIGSPWEFGIHQCVTPRTWNAQAVRLFEEIARRLADGLNTMLVNRNLRESEQRYRLVFENSPVSIWEEDFSGVKALLDDLRRQGVTDLDAWFTQHPETLTRCAQATKILDVNSAAIGLHGASGKEALLTGLVDTFTPESFETFRRELVCLWNGGMQMAEDAVVKTLDGELRNVTIYFAVCPGYESTLGKVVVSLVDITERKQSLEQIRQSETKYRTLIQNIQAAVVVHGPDTRILISNSQAQEILGLSKEQLAGKSAIDPDWHFFREDGKPAPVGEYPVNWVLATRQTIRNLVMGVHRPGREADVWVLVNADPVFDKDGAIAQVIVTFIDISERVQAEQALRVERGLFVAGPSVVFKWRAQEGWPVEYVSPNVASQFGYVPEDITSGKVQYAAIVHPDDIARVAAEVAAFSEQGVASFEQRYRIAGADGRYRWIDDFTTVICGLDGSITHYLGYLQDITERKRAEDITQARLRLLVFAGSHSLDELLTATLDEAELLTGSSIGFYHFVEADQKTLSLHSWSTNTIKNMCTAEGSGSHYAVDQAGVWADCVRERRPLIHNDYASLPHRKGMPEGHAPVVREVVVPIFRGERIVAIIGVGNKTSNYDESDIGIISQLGDLSWDIAERMRVEENLRQMNERFSLSTRAANLGVWDWNLQKNELVWDDRMYELYGVKREDFAGAYEAWLQGIHPDDRAASDEISKQAQRGEREYDTEFRVVWPDGSIHHLKAYGRFVRDAEGNPLRMTGVNFDITGRKQAEEKLRRSEHGLSEAQRIAHLGNWELDLVKNVLTWSDEIYRIFEIEPDKFGASYEAFLNAIHPEDRDMVNKAYTDSVKNKVPYDIVHRLQMPDGRLKYVNEKCETYYGVDGKPLLSFGTVHDITDRILNQQALLRLNRELHAVSNCNQVLMRAENEQALLDEICRIICEDAGYRMTWVGYPESDEGKTIRVIAFAGVEEGYLAQAGITWADTERGRGPSGIAIRSGKSACFQDFGTDPNAAPWRDAALQRGYRSSISMPLKDENANTFGILTIYSAEPDAFTPEEIRLLEELAGDMAFGIRVLRTRVERQQAAVALAQSEYMYRTLAENSPDVIVRYDREGRRIYVNPEFERVNQLTAQQVLGKTPAELSTELKPRVDVFTKRLMAAMASGTPDVIDLSWVKDGKTVYWFVRVVPESDANGNVVSALTIWSDITERKQAEEEIKSLNHELEQRVAARTADLEAANKELESFSYSVSHDLRTPLRAIDGFSHILLEDYADKLDEEGKRLLNVVRNNTNRMGQLIDDILKFSRAGRLEITYSDIDMEQLAYSVFVELRPVVAGDKLQMEIEHIPPARGDGAMLRQVFVNLLSNAIKFSGAREVPRIQVGATVKDDETIYYVKDNGAGFDMQYVDKLFGVFQRLHSMTEFEGTGIGLAIVKRIITRHGGRVWAEGKVGEGATLYFSLPTGGKIGKA